MPASVTPEYLLKGAAYALEQCGLLLRDANVLYRNDSYSSAVALAAFAREELGRHSILLDLRRKVRRGGSVTIKEIQTRCGDHVRKQEAGVLSTVTRTNKNTILGKLHQTYFSSKPGSNERKAAKEKIEEFDQQKKKRVPSDRHEQRMSALYVDAVSSDGWNRPVKEIPQISAFEYLQDAGNDYAAQYQRYTTPEAYTKPLS